LSLLTLLRAERNNSETLREGFLGDFALYITSPQSGRKFPNFLMEARVYFGVRSIHLLIVQALISYKNKFFLTSLVQFPQ
jgi:hypothetical protein